MSVSIHTVTGADREFWFALDRHLSPAAWRQKLRDGQGYVLTVDGRPVGLLRYSLFWDERPFCNLLIVREEERGRGYGHRLMLHWEGEMQRQGHSALLTSARSDEAAQHFYRKLGYRDAGCLLLPLPDLAQPAELFFLKGLAGRE